MSTSMVMFQGTKTELVGWVVSNQSLSDCLPEGRAQFSLRITMVNGIYAVLTNSWCGNLRKRHIGVNAYITDMIDVADIIHD